MRILIVDDDPQMLRALRITLTVQGYEVLTASNGAQGINTAIEAHPDVYLVDLGLPGVDGMSLIQAVRGWSSAPLLVVSGRSGSADKVAALDAGADDYVTKPFSIDELLARIRALTRRIPHLEDTPVLTLGEVVVDFAAHTVLRTRQGRTESVRLTPTEWQVLGILARHPGRLVTRQTMLRAIWGSEHVTDTGYLRLYVSQLRKKLEPDPSRPRYLVTEAGMGYRLDPP
jgi:two-component system KDP operon response regulator KdpE